jgi:hypothetical protein
MKNSRTIINTFLVSITLFISSPALAETEIKLDYDTSSFKDKELTSGVVKVLVSYKKQEDFDNDSNNLQYQVFYNEIPKIDSSSYTRFSGSVFLKDLDNNGSSEVIIKTFSSGAHCCTDITIYTWQNNQFIKTETGLLDGEGGVFEDLDGDRKLEFSTSDNSFLYAFSSYAGSFPPSLIYAFNNGKFENVTRRYVKQLKSRAWEMYQAFLENKQKNYEVNGILAGYVAQKALLGEYQQGWEFMLANYDPTSDWGLTIYQGDQEAGKYSNFPNALKSALIKQGYLDN